MTADVRKDEQERCLAAGMQAFVSKLFEPTELFALTRRMSGCHNETTVVAESPSPTMATTPAAALPADHRDTTMNLTPLHIIANSTKRCIKQVLETFLRATPDKLGRLTAAMAQKDADNVAAMATNWSHFWHHKTGRCIRTPDST